MPTEMVLLRSRGPTGPQEKEGIQWEGAVGENIPPFLSGEILHWSEPAVFLLLVHFRIEITFAFDTVHHHEVQSRSGWREGIQGKGITEVQTGMDWERRKGSRYSLAGLKPQDYGSLIPSWFEREFGRAAAALWGFAY